MSPSPAPAIEIAGAAAEGGRASAVTPLLEVALVQALAEVRPDNTAQLSALNVEVSASPAAGSPLRARAWVDRATRTLAFVSGEVFTADGVRIASGAGVFDLGDSPPRG